MKTVLFTVNYNNILCANTRESFKHAAARWNCEYFEANRETHPIRMHPATVKTEVFTILPTAETIFVIDADAIIRSDCPNPFEVLPTGKLSVVDISHRVDPTGSINHCGKVVEWNRLLALPGVEPIPSNGWRYFNSGVILAFREKHKAMFEEANRICQIPNNLGWIDQTPQNYAAKKLGVEINYMDEAWNYVGHYWHGSDFEQPMPKWICHMAGSPGREKFMENIKWRI